MASRASPLMYISMTSLAPVPSNLSSAVLYGTWNEVQDLADEVLHNLTATDSVV